MFFSSLKTKDVITALLKKFHILDHPRKFALYEQELKNNKIGKLFDPIFSLSKKEQGKTPLCQINMADLQIRVTKN